MSQHVYFNGRELASDSQKLQDAGVSDNDLISVAQIDPSARHPQPTEQSASVNMSQVNQQIETIRTGLVQRAQDPRERRLIAQQAPELEPVLEDPVRFREIFLDQRRRLEERQRAANAEIDALDNDMSEEGQMKIYERIRQQRVAAEAEEAMEAHPELFGSVTMLYVNLEVNGHPVKAFVDSGAQATVMSPSCAEECNITKSIDTRFSGIAKGVGTAKILGRVHMAPMKIANYELPCSFTVMEGKDVDLLLGLDMLKRYQACIDLKENKLVLGGSVSVPFLSESEIPKKFFEAEANEPTVPGPSGTAIGAQSGAVKPVGNFGGQGRTLGSAAATSSASQPAVPAAAPRATTQAAPPPRPSAPTPSHQFPEESISAVVSLGATREQAIQLLQACNGNAEYAAGMFFEM